LSTKPDFKSIRCPLYNFVDLNQRENNVLNSTPMQRLSRIKQLAHTYIVFPSAHHTRLEHSLGTLCLAGRICDKLHLAKKQKQIVRLAALLHDVGQGPFSHIWEEPMRWINGDDFSHEDVTRLLIENEPQIGKALGKYKKEVISLFEEDSLNSDIISSSMDVDKLDYLRRDSYHTGVAYGQFDIERVIHTICKIPEAKRDYLAVFEKGKDALESYRLARYSMHIQVYEHHTRLIADDMFLKAVRLSLEDGCIDREKLKVSNDAAKFIKYYLQLDDHSIQHQILQFGKKIPKDLINSIRNRQLLKRALVIPLTKDGIPNAIKREKIIRMNRNEIQKVENEIAEELRIDPAYVVVHLQSVKIKLYERFEEMLGKKEKPIYVKKRNGTVSSFDEESPITASLNPIRQLFVFCPKKYVSSTKKVATDKLELESPI
jgi:hypothetical protein